MKKSILNRIMSFIVASFMILSTISVLPEECLPQIVIRAAAEESYLYIKNIEQINPDTSITINWVYFNENSSIGKMNIDVHHSENFIWNGDEGLCVYIYGMLNGSNTYKQIARVRSSGFGSSTIDFMVDGPTEVSPSITYSDIYFDLGYEYGGNNGEKSFVSCTKVYTSTKQIDYDDDNDNYTIHIYTPEELIVISEKNISHNGYSGVTISIENDINMNGINWIPIGTEESPFKGNIEGNGHTISNINISEQQYGGLVGYAEISNTVTMRNLNLINYTYNATMEKDLINAVLIGNVKVNNGGTLNIDNISTTGKSNVYAKPFKYSYCGGIIGKAIASANSYININNVKTNNSHDYYTYSLDYTNEGGLIGQYVGTDNSSTLNINKSVSNSAIYSYSSFGYCSASAGGLIGSVEKGNVILEQCCVNGKVCGKSYYIYTGGIIGSINSANVTINNCLVQPSIIQSQCTNGDAALGGFVGHTNNSFLEINNSFFSSETSGNVKAGFVAWYSPSAIINNCYFDIDTTEIPKNKCVVDCGFFNSNWITDVLFNSYGITLTQINKKATYNNWDFDNIWVINDNGMPALRWMTDSSNTEENPHPKVDYKTIDFINQHYFAAIPEYWNRYHEVADTMAFYDDNLNTEIAHSTIVGIDTAVNVINVEVDGVIKQFSSNAYNAILLDMYYDLVVNNNDFIQIIYKDSLRKSVKETMNPMLDFIKQSSKSGKDLIKLDEFKFEDDLEKWFEGEYSGYTFIDLLEKNGLTFASNADKTSLIEELKVMGMTSEELGEIGDIVKGINTANEYMDNLKSIICAQALKNMNETYRQLLIEIKMKAKNIVGHSWEKSDLINALDYEIYYRKYYNAHITWEVGKTLYGVVSASKEFSELKKKLFEKPAEEFIKSTFKNGTAILSKISAVQFGSKVGWSISDEIFNLTESTDLYYKGKAYGVLENILIDILNETSPQLEYSTESDSAFVIKERNKVAQKFDYAFRMYIYVEAIGCETYSKYEKSYLPDEDNWLKAFMHHVGNIIEATVRVHFGDLSVFGDISKREQLRNYFALHYQRRADFVKNNLKCHGNEFNSLEGVKAYSQEVSDKYFEMLEEDIKLAAILCPVEVDVYDESGNLVGTISKTQNTIENNSNVFAYRNEALDANIIVYDASYSIKIRGTDEGTMKVFGSYFSNNDIQNAIAYVNVPISNDFVADFDFDIDNDTLIDNDSKLLTIKINNIDIIDFDKSITQYIADIDTDTTEIPTITATPSNENAAVSIKQAISLIGTEAERTATITVTAEDGTTQTIYTVTFVLVNNDNENITIPNDPDITPNIPSIPSIPSNSSDISSSITPNSSIPKTFNVKVENKITGKTNNAKATRTDENVIVDVGNENNGYYANIYTTDENLIYSFKIENGKAKFIVQNDIDFYIIIDKDSHIEYEDVSSGAGIYELFDDKKEPFCMFVVIIAALGFSSIIIVKRFVKKKH